MDASAFDDEPSWHWPQYPSSQRQEQPQPHAPPHHTESRSPPRHSGNHAHTPKPRHYPPRTCRICLETVLPTFETNPMSIPGVLNPLPSVSYKSSDPTLGRLLRPCKCKGTSRYVHEGCLQAWRHADPSYGRRNYWICPTCGFKYQLERMQWGRWISSTGAQIALTVLLLLGAVFILGFVGDPIINLYLDPVSTISKPLTGRPLDPILDEEDARSWAAHLLKGLASLGLLSFVKVLIAMSPWQWWNLRNSGLLNSGGRPATTGRDRLQSVSWVVVLIGVGTFLWGVYKLVRAWSRRMLETAGERVMDVQGDDEYESEEPQPSTTRPETSAQESRKDQ